MTEQIYQKSNNALLRHFIKQELQKNNLSTKTDIPVIARKKLIVTCIFSLLTLALVSTEFFHFSQPLLKWELLNIALYIFFLYRFNTMNYLMKEVKNRPDEDIGFIVTSLLSDSGSPVRARVLRWSILAAGFILPVVLFLQPHMIFEHGPEGCYLRYYTKGIMPQYTVEVPAQHKGEDVVGIRGNVFANLEGVYTVILPDTIDVIRGHAFYYCYDLETVVMPQTLSYLGGSAFENCYFLNDITIPQGLTEIKGSTFDSCGSLTNIKIPEGVTRIGAHAFYFCTELQHVSFPSTLREIGSSAFRDCWELQFAVLPEGVIVDERAFKDSETTIVYR